MSLIQYTALFGGVALGLLFLLEVRRWRSLGAIIGARQRTLRMALIVLMEGLLAMILVGPWVIGEGNILGELIYWTVGMIVGVAVLVLAMLDLRLVAARYAQMSRRTFGGSFHNEDRDAK